MSIFSNLFFGLFATSWSDVTIAGLIGSQLLIAVAVALYLVVRWYYGVIQKVKTIPTLDGCHWLLGHIPTIKDLVYDKGYLVSDALFMFLDEAFKKNPALRETGILAVWVGPIPFTILFTPETAEIVLTNNKQLLQKAFLYDFFAPWLGDGILVANGHKWTHARRMLAPAFHYRVLDDVLPKVNSDARSFLNYIGELTKENDGVVSDIAEPVMLCALDNICHSVMGTKIEPYTPRGKKFNECVNNANLMIFDRAYKPWLWLDFIYYRSAEGKRYQSYVDFIRNYTTEMVANRKKQVLKEIESGSFEIKGKHPVMDTCLLEHISDPEKFTLEDVREEVTTIVFDGHETTGWAMVWAVWLLGHNPEAQKRCQAEIDKVFACDGDRDLNMEDISKLEYLECCMKESQRLYPSVPLIGRHVDSDTEVAGHTLPGLSSVFVISRLIHRDQRHWPEPLKYYPERFLPENSQGRHPYAHIPFSAGARNCLGQKFAINEEKIVLAHLLRNYNIESVTERVYNMETPAVITRYTKPLSVKITKRVRV